VITLQHAPPSQVVLQVLGGNPMKASHPLLEAAVVGVDVLNVERPIDDPNALLDIDGSMGQAKGACHRLIHPRAIGAKNGILIHQGAQHGRDVGRVDTFEPKVSRLSAALAYHQDSNMLPVRAYPAAFACRSMQLAFALEGFQEESLVGFDNPSLVRGAVRGRSLKKAMAPEKRSVFIHTASLGRLAHAHPLNQGLTIAQPLFTFAQVRQGRAGERIAGLAASAAAHTCQPMAVTPGSQLFACAQHGRTPAGESPAASWSQ
jgi:hypothetical protein